MKKNKKHSLPEMDPKEQLGLGGVDFAKKFQAIIYDEAGVCWSSTRV